MSEHIASPLSEALNDYSAFLRSSNLGKGYRYFEIIDSTNTYVRLHAEELMKEGISLVIAGEQSAGRGRTGKQFYSPGKHGIYMTFLLHPMKSPNDLSLMTVITVLAVRRAIRTVCGFAPDVKWVNDILYHDKKLCGILVEAIADQDSGLIRHLIIGIGINVSEDPDLPNALKPIAGALEQFMNESCNRGRLIAETANELEKVVALLNEGKQEDLLKEYHDALAVFGKEYEVFSPTGSRTVTPVDLDSEAHLIVRETDGSLTALHSGEISMKKK